MDPNRRPWSPPQMIFSALVGIAVWTAVGFSWFGYGFGWESQGSALRMAQDAVIEKQATICAAQARSAPDAAPALLKLRDETDWKRKGLVESAGWATMPGDDSAKGGVAALCASKLLAG